VFLTSAFHCGEWSVSRSGRVVSGQGHWEGVCVDPKARLEILFTYLVTYYLLNYLLSYLFTYLVTYYLVTYLITYLLSYLFSYLYTYLLI